MGRKLLVVTVVAFALMGGSAVAGSRWLITSKHQIKPNVLHQLKGNRGKRGPRGFKGARGRRGARGATGATGATGARGPAGLGQVVDVEGPSIALAPGQSNVGYSDDATCPAGDVAVGTGFDDGGVMTVGFVEAFGSFVGGSVSNDSSVTASYNWQAICAPSDSGASSMAVRAQHPSLRSLKMAAYQKWQAAH